MRIYYNDLNWKWKGISLFFLPGFFFIGLGLFGIFGALISIVIGGFILENLLNNKKKK